jgi:hypothetical protein
MLKKYSYSIHKRLAWIVFIPTLLWALSGIMHPFMSHWFKTRLPQEEYKAEKVPANLTVTEFHHLLKINGIDEFNDLHVVTFHGKSYAQILDEKGIIYIDINTGKRIKKSDENYAQHIARYITKDLENPVKLTKITAFTSEYKSVNKYLPVYKVQFDRPDQMDIYVSTAESKFITFNDLKRKTFIHIFSWFHTWDFLNFLPSVVTISLMLAVLLILFLTAISGLLIYGLFYKVFVKIEPTKRDKYRVRHRVLGLSFSFFVFTFALSGAFHVWMKFNPKSSEANVLKDRFSSEELQSTSTFNLASLNGFGLVHIANKIYAQHLDTNDLKYRYIDLKNGKELKDGHQFYSLQLLNKFRDLKNQRSTVASITWTTEFTNEYGFINKYLPVMRYEFNDADRTTYYIDPAAQKLTAEIKQLDRYEGFSFAFLHKFHFLDTLGKNFRDATLVFFALGISLTTFLGIRMLKRKKIDP